MTFANPYYQNQYQMPQYLSEMIKDVVDEISYICSIKY